jgi:hypothetical protein
MIIERNHAGVVCNWLVERLRGHSSEGITPTDMPLCIDEVTVQTWKDGKGSYILFTPEDCIMAPMKDMSVQSLIEYDQGFMRVGMGDAYTISMIAEEFGRLTQGPWGFYPVHG